MRTVAPLLALFVLVYSQDTCNKYSNTSYCNTTHIDWNTVNIPPCGDPTDPDSLVFFVLGDYGFADGQCEGLVAGMADRISQTWPVDFIMTVGDNNYFNGSCDVIDKNIGQFYGSYFPAGPSCVNPGSLESARFKDRDVAVRFFPTPGNHDYKTFAKYGWENLPYSQYFSFLSGFEPTSANGEYYVVDPTQVIGSKGHLLGLLNIFALNSNLGETNKTEKEAWKMRKWLETALDDSQAAYKIVFFHHSPFTTAQHDPPADWLRWDFGAMGATTVFTGHEHTYERVQRNGTFTYVVNGLGGNVDLYEISGPECPPVEGSVIRYNDSHGIALVVLSKKELRMCMYAVQDGGAAIADEFTIPSPSSR